MTSLIILVAMFWPSEALASDVGGYVEVGLRPTWWAFPGVNDYSGAVSEVGGDPADDDFGPSDPWKLELERNPTVFRTVTASVGLADKWYVGLLIDDDATWSQLRRIAGVVRIAKAQLMLETATISGTVKEDPDYGIPVNLTLPGDTFDTRYAYGTVTWGSSAHLGVGFMEFGYPMVIEAASGSVLTAELDMKSRIGLYGIAWGGSDYGACVRSDRGCAQSSAVRVWGDDRVRWGVNVDFRTLAGVARQRPSDVYLSANRGVETHPAWGYGVGLDVGARAFLLATVRPRVRISAYVGVLGTEQFFILRAPGVEEPATPPEAKLATSTMMFMNGGPRFGVAASF